MSSDFEVTVQPVKLGHSQALADLSSKLGHLTPVERDQLSSLVNKETKGLFPDVPGRAKGIHHDVDAGDSPPIKQHPYRVGPVKKQIMDREIQYMLDNDIIEPCSSPWSSPCLLVPKPDGSSRFVTDFRKVNAVTKVDCYPRTDTLIDDVANTKFATKLDLLKGYWQIPLTKRAKDIIDFSNGNNLYRYLVCPLGMRNSDCTFQRFMDIVMTGLEHTRVYMDDLISI